MKWADKRESRRAQKALNTNFDWCQLSKCLFSFTCALYKFPCFHFIFNISASSSIIKRMHVVVPAWIRIFPIFDGAHLDNDHTFENKYSKNRNYLNSKMKNMGCRLSLVSLRFGDILLSIPLFCTMFYKCFKKVLAYLSCNIKMALTWPCKSLLSSSSQTSIQMTIKKVFSEAYTARCISHAAIYLVTIDWSHICYWTNGDHSCIGFLTNRRNCNGALELNLIWVIIKERFYVLVFPFLKAMSVTIFWE